MLRSASDFQRTVAAKASHLYFKVCRRRTAVFYGCKTRLFGLYLTTRRGFRSNVAVACILRKRAARLRLED